MAPAGAVKIPILKHFAACQTLFIGAFKEKEKKNEKEKEKDDQYKLKRPMAIAIGLIIGSAEIRVPFNLLKVL